MKNEDKLKVARKRKEINNAELQKLKYQSEQKTKEELEYLESIKNSIEGLAEALSVNVHFPEIQPLFDKLELLNGLPDSFKELKEQSENVLKALSQDKPVKIDGFRDLWEMMVRQNNKVYKENKAHQQEFAQKLWDVQAYLDALTETIKQGQKPEDYKPVRLVVGGDGTPLDFLKQFPTSRGGGSGGSSGGLTDAELRATPVPVSGTIDVLNIGSLQYGLNASIATSVTDTVKSYTAIAGDYLRGFVATGSRSGLFRLKINGTAVLPGRIAPGTETVDVFLPIARSLTAGDTVLLEVTNEGQGTGSFEGSIIIEN